MAGITERNQQKLELASVGFSLKYIDEWQPKTTLYRHKASYTSEGKISQDIGSTIKGVPGSPDYVLRKAKIGLFPWKPGGQCECRWCQERVSEKEVSNDNDFHKSCDLCDFEAVARSKGSATAKLNVHTKEEHN